MELISGLPCADTEYEGVHGDFGRGGSSEASTGGWENRRSVRRSVGQSSLLTSGSVLVTGSSGRTRVGTTTSLIESAESRADDSGIEGVVFASAS